MDLDPEHDPIASDPLIQQLHAQYKVQVPIHIIAIDNNTIKNTTPAKKLYRA